MRQGDDGQDRRCVPLSANPPQRPAGQDTRLAWGVLGGHGRGQGTHSGDRGTAVPMPQRGQAPAPASSVPACGGQGAPAACPCLSGQAAASPARLGFLLHPPRNLKQNLPPLSCVPPAARRLPGQHRSPCSGPRAPAPVPGLQGWQGAGSAGSTRTRSIHPRKTPRGLDLSFPLTLTQRGRRGRWSGHGTHTRGDNGNKYGVEVARARPLVRWPQPVPTPQPPAQVEPCSSLEGHLFIMETVASTGAAGRQGRGLGRQEP